MAATGIASVAPYPGNISVSLFSMVLKHSKMLGRAGAPADITRRREGSLMRLSRPYRPTRFSNAGLANMLVTPCLSTASMMLSGFALAGRVGSISGITAVMPRAGSKRANNGKVGRSISPGEGIKARIIRISDDALPEWSEDLTLAEGEIGEIAVQGDQVTRSYYHRPKDDKLGKIRDGGLFWHRMGDLGWFDKEARLWFCGRKSHRVITDKETLFTIPCEAIFNNHPDVFRSALIGLGKAGEQKPVICIELEKSSIRKSKKKLTEELLDLAKSNVMTAGIDTFLFHKSFPVDIRHNSKIFREKLVLWAKKKIR